MKDLEISNRFNAAFSNVYATELMGGGDEPLYLPPTPFTRGRILYNRDFAASALHELAHWLIAGRHRRCLIDYGYPYLAAPRSAVQQHQFYQLEVRTQGLEKLLTQRCGLEFQVSVDNLAVVKQERLEFQQRVERASVRWRESGLPRRAKRLLKVLSE